MEEIIEMTPEEFAAASAAASTVPSADSVISPVTFSTSEPNVVEMTPEEFAAQYGQQSDLGAIGRGVTLGAAQSLGFLGDIQQQIMPSVIGARLARALGADVSDALIPRWGSASEQMRGAVESTVGLPDYSGFENPRFVKAASEGLGGALVTAPFAGIGAVGKGAQAVSQGVNALSGVLSSLGAEYAPDAGINPVVGALIGGMSPQLAVSGTRAALGSITQGGREAAAGSALAGALGEADTATLATLNPKQLKAAGTLAEAVPTTKAALFEDAVRNTPTMGDDLIAYERGIQDQLKAAQLAPIGGAIPRQADELGAAAIQEGAARKAALEKAADNAWTELRKSGGMTGQQLDLTSARMKLARDLSQEEGVFAFNDARKLLENASGKGNLQLYRTQEGRVIANLEEIQKLRSAAGEAATRLAKGGSSSEARVIRNFRRNLDDMLEREATEMMGIAPENAESYRQAIAATRNVKEKFKGTWLEKMADGRLDEKTIVNKLLANKTNAAQYVKAFKDDPGMMQLGREAVATKLQNSTNPVKDWLKIRKSAQQVLSPGHYNDLVDALKSSQRRADINALLRASSPGQSTTAPRKVVMDYLKAATEPGVLGSDIIKNSSVLGFAAQLINPQLTVGTIAAAVTAQGARAIAKVNKAAVGRLLSQAASDPVLAQKLVKTASKQNLQELANYINSMRSTAVAGSSAGARKTRETPQLIPQQQAMLQPSAQPAPEPMPSPQPTNRTPQIQDPLIKAIVDVESAGKPNAVSSAGAIGLMQVMPVHGERLGVDLFDPQQNLMAGQTILKEELDRFQSLPLALAAYNAGSPKVMAAIKKAGSRDFNEIKRFLPEETRKYVPKVMARYQKYDQENVMPTLKPSASDREILARYNGMGGLDEMIQLYRQRGKSGQSFEDFAFGADPEQRFGASVQNISASSKTPTWDYAANEARTISDQDAAGYLQNIENETVKDPIFSKKERAQILAIVRSKASSREKIQALQKYFTKKAIENNQMEIA